MEQHVFSLGRLVENLQSLEFALRAFLVNDEPASGGSSPQSEHLADLNVGDTVPLNAFTNYDGLLQCIRKYNNRIKTLSDDLKVDETLVDIRDAIAHGRVSASSPSASLHLLKFSRPKTTDNHVKVTFSISMTEEWLSGQTKRVYKELLKVSEANHILARPVL